MTANTNTQIIALSRAWSIKSDKVRLSWGGFKRVAEKLDRKYKTQVTGHCFTNTERLSQTLVKANLRPKNFCLGLIRPIRLAFTSVWDSFCIGETMTCDLCFVSAENWGG